MSWEVRTMRSATSYFNSTLYHKTLARFWPLWGLYGLIWLFLIPLRFINQYFSNIRWGGSLAEAQQWLLDSALDLPSLLSSGVWLSLFFGVLCAMACFSYLFNSRSACMMHALPLRREGLFFTQYLAGLSFFLLPHLVVAGIAAATELSLLPMGQWGQALSALGLWLAVQSATALFFYSFAAFCAMFTGHILALPAFYAILNALVVVVYTLVKELMSRFFYGFPSSGYGDFMGLPLVRWCTPVYTLTEACRWTSETIYQGDNALSGPLHLFSPSTVAAYAAAGVALAALALLVYRVRQVESAGDVVAIPLVRPLFRWGVALCSGLCLGVFTASFFGWAWNSVPLSLCVLAWTLVGWFAAEMLLKKSFRVLGAWKGGLVATALVGVLCLSFFLDLFGVVGRVPQAQDVARLTVSGSFSYPSDSGELYLNGITDQETIQEFIDLHAAIVRERDRADYDSPTYEPGDDYLTLQLTYTLNGGATLSRPYISVPLFKAEVNAQGTVTHLAQSIISDRDLAERCYDFDRMEQGRLVEAWLSDVLMLPSDYSSGGRQDILYLDGAAGEDLEGLWQAVRADFRDGTIGVRYLFDDEERAQNTYITDLVFLFDMPRPSRPNTDSGLSRSQLTITLTPNAQRTLAWLKTFSALDSQYALLPHSYDPGAADLTDTFQVPGQPGAEAAPLLPETIDQETEQQAPALSEPAVG